MKRVSWIVGVRGVAFALMLALSGCGQKGPLYLPDKNASVVTRPAGAGATTPAPSTPGATPAETPQTAPTGGASPSESLPQQAPSGTAAPTVVPPKSSQDKNGQNSSSTPPSQ